MVASFLPVVFVLNSSHYKNSTMLLMINFFGTVSVYSCLRQKIWPTKLHITYSKAVFFFVICKHAGRPVFKRIIHSKFDLSSCLFEAWFSFVNL